LDYKIIKISKTSKNAKNHFGPIIDLWRDVKIGEIYSNFDYRKIDDRNTHKKKTP